MIRNYKLITTYSLFPRRWERNKLTKFSGPSCPWASSRYSCFLQHTYICFMARLLKDTPLLWIYKNSKYDLYGIFTGILLKEKRLWRRREIRGKLLLPTSFLSEWLAMSGICSLNGPMVSVIREWDTSVSSYSSISHKGTLEIGPILPHYILVYFNWILNNLFVFRIHFFVCLVNLLENLLILYWG